MREREQKRRNSCSNSAKGEGEGKKICCSCCSYTQKKIIAVILKLVRKRNTHKHLFPCRSQDISFTFFIEIHPTKYYCVLSHHTQQLRIFFSHWNWESKHQREWKKNWRRCCWETWKDSRENESKRGRGENSHAHTVVFIVVAAVTKKKHFFCYFSSSSYSQQ